MSTLLPNQITVPERGERLYFAKMLVLMDDWWGCQLLPRKPGQHFHKVASFPEKAFRAATTATSEAAECRSYRALWQRRVLKTGIDGNVSQRSQNERFFNCMSSRWTLTLTLTLDSRLTSCVYRSNLCVETPRLPGEDVHVWAEAY